MEGATAAVPLPYLLTCFLLAALSQSPGLLLANLVDRPPGSRAETKARPATGTGREGRKLFHARGLRSHPRRWDVDRFRLPGVRLLEPGRRPGLCELRPPALRRGETLRRPARPGNDGPRTRGRTLTIKARAETTGGRFTLFENLVAPKEGPPLHRHGREDEMWYILEGRFRFRADGEIFLAPAGSFVFIPRGTAHCLQNIGDRPSRILVMFTPAGMERFFERHAELPPGPVDPGAYRAIAHDSAMEVVGRPLAESDPL